MGNLAVPRNLPGIALTGERRRATRTGYQYVLVSTQPLGFWRMRSCMGGSRARAIKVTTLGEHAWVAQATALAPAHLAQLVVDEDAKEEGQAAAHIHDGWGSRVED